MTEQLRKQVQSREKKHKKFLLTYRLGESLLDCAARGFAPFRDGLLRGVIALVSRLFLLLILYGLTRELLHMAIGYLALHGVIALTGKILSDIFYKKLKGLEQLVQKELEIYNRVKQQEYAIEDGCVLYDGMLVANGCVVANMRRDYGRIQLYQLDKWEEYGKFSDRVHDRGDWGQSLREYISSVSFNERFGVIVEKGQEMDGIKFLSPSVQVRLLQAKAVETFSEIAIADMRFRAKTPYNVEAPMELNVFGWKSFVKVFEDVDRYCTQMKEMGDKVCTDMQHLDFLLGTAA